MPLNLHVPLPGPFSYSRRLAGGRRRSGRSGGGGDLAYWALIGWWWVMLKWTVLGMVWLAVALWTLCAQTYRAARR